MRFSLKLKIISVFILVAMIISGFTITSGRVFDIRTNKTYNPGVFPVQIDNLPHLYCCSQAAYAYSGIFVEQNITVSGSVENSSSVDIAFPSGKIESIEVKNGYFKKNILFDEEGTYSIADTSFEVVYRATPLSPTSVYTEIFGLRPQIDVYSGSFVDWNDSILVEKGKSVNLFLLLLDGQGNPIPNLNTRTMNTNADGVASLSVASTDSFNVYGPVKKVDYVKIAFDKNGKQIYASENKKVKSILNDDKIFVSIDDFTRFALSQFGQDTFKQNVEIGDGYIYLKGLNTAFPVESYEVNQETYADLESFIRAIDCLTYGTSIRYYPDRTEYYVAIEPEIP
jgi:hypothetical protein